MIWLLKDDLTGLIICEIVLRWVFLELLKGVGRGIWLEKIVKNGLIVNCMKKSIRKEIYL